MPRGSASAGTRGSSSTSREGGFARAARLIVVALCVLLAAGCSRSDDTVAGETTSQSTTTETTPPPDFSGPPRTYREVMARLPPFDEPASPDVATWRKATISALFGRCSSSKGGADETTFVSANRQLLKETAVFPGARLVHESSIAQKDGNGCPEGLGPATSYVTHRSYRLPEGAKPEAVLGHYQREFYGSVAASSGAACERTFGLGPSYVVVSACSGVLRLSVRARAPVQPAAAAPGLPRPLGLQYPLVEDRLATRRPTAFDSEPGETCERIHGSEVPSIIIPPAPGVRATIRGRELVVRWTLGTVHGDCPPSQLMLSSSTVTAHTIRVPVRAASGATRMPLLGSVARPTKLTAATVSVDGVESRRVSVLVGN